MKIIIAPDSFKESLSAEETAKAIELGFREIYPTAEYLCLPVADGGEGTVDALVAATGGKKITVKVKGPLGYQVQAFYGITGNGKTAIIEMAAASGLMLVEPNQRNPLTTTSYGTGELIKHALGQGIRHIILGIGGSATVDGGVGMMQALGVRFSDHQGNELANGGGALCHLSMIDTSNLDDRIANCKIEVACDVDNPLTGSQGAAVVFGPQKGANTEMVEQLERGLLNYAKVLQSSFGEDVNSIVGGGAAGGLGIATKIFLKGQLKPGIEIILEAIELEKHLVKASFVVTGEGRIDQQTIHGKAPVGVAKLAKKYHVPVIGIAGVLGENFEVVHQHGIDAVFSILPRLMSLDHALREGKLNVQHCARNIASTLKLGQLLKPL